MVGPEVPAPERAKRIRRLLRLGVETPASVKPKTHIQRTVLKNRPCQRAARAVSVEHKRQSMSVLAGSYIACNLTVTESLATRLA